MIFENYKFHYFEKFEFPTVRCDFEKIEFPCCDFENYKFYHLNFLITR